MQGEYHGFSAQLSNVAKNQMHIRCYTHVLCLVIGDVTNKILQSINLFGILNGCAVFIKESHKRIDFQNPKYPELTTFALRLITFDLFTLKHLNKLPMCEVGFEFLGAVDCVQCFNYGLILHEWEIKDDPWKEHAYHSPVCSFVQLKKATNS
ncbi:BIR repeat [Cinara cedri]|uniref:BIR repeat n=1 Tax=Cinara cedri TaxID=506608 RepID=A0A5E4MQS3_9HEMI|nr:BIR repeat [Cinara cedri]